MKICVNLLLLIVFILQIIIGLFVGTVYKEGISEYLQIYITQLIPIFIPSLLCCFSHKEGFNAFKRDGRITALKIVMVIILSVCVNLMTNVFTQKLYYPLVALFSNGNTTKITSLVPKSGFDIVLNVVFICLLPAIFEEILFRGVVLTNYENLYGSKKAITMCGLVFALLHASLYSLIPQFIIGVFIAFVVFRYNSIYYGMIAHFVHNLTTLTLHLAAGDSASNISFLTEDWLITLIVCVSVSVVIFAITNKIQKKVFYKSPISDVKKIEKEKKYYIMILVLFVIMQILSIIF